MSTALTATVTVNAAFLQEIKEDNRELRQLLRSVRLMMSGVSVRRRFVRPRRVVGLLQRLRDQLAMHFALEEAYGYFEDAVSVAPRLCCEALELRSQHEVMFLEMCRIVDRAERLVYQPTSGTILPQQVATEFVAWHDQFQDHERRETNLVLAAFHDDMGAGD